MHPSPRRPHVDALERRQLFAAILSDVDTAPVGALTGKIVYTSGGHGFVSDNVSSFRTQRGLNNGIVEDLGNQDQMTYFADEALRAGATVVPMRPVGHQAAEVIVDNQQATFTGAWGDGSSNPYYSTTNGTGVTYRFANTSTTQTAVAKFTPTLTKADFYPVYAWALSGTDRSTDQVYRVNHAGGATEVKVNHQRVGKGWVYLGTYRFDAGTSGNVEVSNKSATTGKVVIADAIRFGNGKGDVAVNGVTSGRLREDEASLYWVTASAGWTKTTTGGVTTVSRVASSNWRTSSDDDTANVAAPLRWAAYMNTPTAGKTNSVGESVYISFHSNAGGGRGADGLINDDLVDRSPNQVALATYLGKEITNDLVAAGSPPLEHAFQNTSDPTFQGDFGELDGGTIANEFDATIIEVAFHDNQMDAELMRDPFVRAKMAQSTLQGAVRYFNQFGGAPLIFAPDAPTNVRALGSSGNGNVTVSWTPPATSSIFGGAPTGYRVYASRDGYSFDGGSYVAGGGSTSLKVFASALGGQPAYFKVVAVNAGGESPASGVVSARAGSNEYGRVLIVNGFDRLDRTTDVIEAQPINGTSSASAGTAVAGISRVRPREGNSFDYSVQHAQAIASVANIGFDTADNEAVLAGQVNLASYNGVIWISGEESTADDTFNSAEQNLVRNYLANGGKFMVSGSEVGYDLVGQSGGATFFNSTLHSGYASDSAGTYAASGASGSIFAGLNLGFDNGTGSTYNVNSPDRLTASNGSTAVLNYVGGTGGVAATAYSAGAAKTSARTLVMGFGFETITDAAVRNALMSRTLAFFGLSTRLAAAGATLSWESEAPIGGLTAAYLSPLDTAPPTIFMTSTSFGTAAPTTVGIGLTTQVTRFTTSSFAVQSIGLA